MKALLEGNGVKKEIWVEPDPEVLPGDEDRYRLVLRTVFSEHASAQNTVLLTEAELWDVKAAIDETLIMISLGKEKEHE